MSNYGSIKIEKIPSVEIKHYVVKNVKFVGDKIMFMNTAKIKLELFRKIDSLNESELEKVYKKIIGFLNAETSNKSELTPELKDALDEALESSRQGKTYTHEEVMKETRKKYPNLFK